MTKKRKIRKEIKYFLYIIGIFFIIGILVNFFNIIKMTNYKTENKNVGYITNKKCFAYYPKDGGKYAKTIANELCILGEENFFDYEISDIKEYKYIDYHNGISYLLDKDMKELVVKEINEDAKKIISDYLRYTMKSKGLDYAYTLNFLESSYYENINYDNIKISFMNKDLICTFDEYEVDVRIPLKYIGKYIGIDLGNNEIYKKPSYVDPNRKAIAITFDDGPNIKEETTKKIIDELYKYDANATFFLLGNRLYDKTENIIADGIFKGNQYGSHSCNHVNLKKITKDEIYSEIMDVADWLKNNLNYDMNVYRPPYGSFNTLVDETIPLAAILWDIDSNDWYYRDSKLIYDEVMNDVKDLSVIIFHDIYESTAQTMVDEALIKNLIKDGYQLVTVDEIAKLRNVELKQAVHLCWGD